MPNQINLARAARPISRQSGKLGISGSKGVATGLLLLLLLSLCALVLVPVAAAAKADLDLFELYQLKDIKYWQRINEYKEKAYQPVSGTTVEFSAASYTATGDAKVQIVTELGGRHGKFLEWGEDGWVEWKVNVPTTGLYNIGVEYYPITGKRSSIQRDIQIDGDYPFSEAKRLEFKRVWADAGLPEKDNQGNDIRPKQIEKPEWREVRLQDSSGLYREPFQFYLTAGEHTIRLNSIREPIALGNIELLSPEVIPSYAEVKKMYDEKGYKEAKGVSFKIQAERPYLKSDPTIRGEYGSDPLSEPPAKGSMVINEFGSWNWRNGGQWVTWKVKVQKSGLYKFGFRGYQGWDGKPSIRTLTIDGKIPFKEADELGVPYDNRNQQIYIPSDSKKKPYLFYLEKGEHLLGLEVKVGPLRDTLNVLEGTMRELSKISRQIIMVTGVNPDPNGDYELDKQIPDLLPRLKKISKDLDTQIKFLTKFCGKRPNAANTLLMVSQQMKDMVADPEEIPGRFSDFSTAQSSLGTWFLNLKMGPWLLDYIWVASPEQKAPRAVPTFLERTFASTYTFLLSFKKDYTGVGSIHKKFAGTVLDVWISRGREWAEIIKDMAEDDFTPATGIKVNINILPGGQSQVLLLACTSGRAPDVALGVSAGLPVDFAIRGALRNLNTFPDYKEVVKRFRPGALIPFKYDGGDWAIPEDQDFSMLFYRTDIMAQLGITKIPDTWEDVYKLLPILQQNGLDFYVPMGFFTPFLFQRGANYYTADGKSSALDTPQAMKAFEEWTDLYTKYKIQQQANFFNRMRTGEMPIGISGYWDYILLSTAAPELTGWWKTAPMPGHRRPDGVVDRSTGGASNTAVIFKSSKKQDAAWEFIKWWTSTSAQVRFGSELEALLGSEARWNTANVEALQQLPWPKDDIKAVMEQWRWFKETPVVLGGYFTGRHITNAWNRVVLQGMNPREAVELAVKDINRELMRKQEEFGVKTKEKKLKD